DGGLSRSAVAVTPMERRMGAMNRSGIISARPSRLTPAYRTASAPALSQCARVDLTGVPPVRACADYGLLVAVQRNLHRAVAPDLCPNRRRVARLGRTL